MPVIISMLRGVNLGPNHRIKMDALRALYESLGLKDVETCVQSGNVVFRCEARDLGALANRAGVARDGEKLGSPALARERADL
jgi:uncharacterized protein (DUF1697 family)